MNNNGKNDNKEMTLEELAAMVQRGFAGTATKADVEELRNELVVKLDEVSLKIDAYATLQVKDTARIHELVDRMTTVEKRLETLEMRGRKKLSPAA